MANHYLANTNADVWPTVGCVRIRAFQRRSNYCCTANMRDCGALFLKTRRNVRIDFCAKILDFPRKKCLQIHAQWDHTWPNPATSFVESQFKFCCWKNKIFKPQSIDRSLSTKLYRRSFHLENKHSYLMFCCQFFECLLQIAMFCIYFLKLLKGMFARYFCENLVAAEKEYWAWKKTPQIA